MANSYLNIVTFLLTTLFYYLAIKPSLTYDTLIDPIKYKEFASKNYLYLAIYLFVVDTTPLLTNVCIIFSYLPICNGVGAM